MAKVPYGIKNIAKNFNRLSRVHECYRQTTDRQTTDGRTTTSQKTNVRMFTLSVSASLFVPEATSIL